eukprot:gene12589-26510_t
MLSPSLFRKKNIFRSSCSLFRLFPRFHITSTDRQITHIKSETSDRISTVILDELKLSICHLNQLFSSGSIYYKSVTDTKPKRIFKDCDIIPGEYIRVHTSPRSYKDSSINLWQASILFQNDDFILISKPSGYPTIPTVDNYHENALIQIQNAINTPLFAVHRLDTDTSGLLLLAKTKTFTSQFNKLLRNRAVTKTYSLLLVSKLEQNPHPSSNFTSTSAPPLILTALPPQLKVNQILTHHMVKSGSSPKVFLPHKTDTSFECTSRIVSVSPSIAMSRNDWMLWAQNLPEQSQHQQKQNDNNNNRNNNLNHNTNDNKIIISNCDLSTQTSLPSLCVTGSPVGVRTTSSSYTSSSSATTNNDNYTTNNSKLKEAIFCAIEIELITGRTHQLRGQSQLILIEQSQLIPLWCTTTTPVIERETDAKMKIEIKIEMELFEAQMKTAMESESETEKNFLSNWDNMYTGVTSTVIPDQYRSSPYLALQATKLEFFYTNKLEDTNSTSTSISFQLPCTWWQSLTDFLYNNNPNKEQPR